MDDELITSLSNQFVKRARKLRHRKFRENEGVYLLEGITHTLRALEHAAPLESLIVAPELLTSAPAWDAISAFESSGGRVVRLGRDAFESITERDHPSGLGATVRLEDPPLTDLVAERSGFYVAMHDVGNPGNLGTTVRTADALGCGGVIVVGSSTDVFHPASVKASMGALYTVPVHRCPSFEDLVAWCLMEKVAMVATSARRGEDLHSATIPQPCVLLLGSEAAGLPDEAIERADQVLRIPMRGAVSSLNLAVAAGMFLYELRRRRDASA